MLAILVFVLSLLNVSFALNSSDTITDIINKSTCLIGNNCRDCPEDRVEVIERNGFSFKVCCPNCGPNLYLPYLPGTLFGDILCNCPVIEGNCWTGRQCEECFHGPNRSNIGLVDGIYLCCPNCRWSGKNITLGNPSRCDCHFRDEKEAPDNENDPNDWNNIKDSRERMEEEHQKLIDDHEKAKKVLEELNSFGSLRSMQDNMYAMGYGGSDRKGSTMQDLKETEYDDDGDDDDDDEDDDDL